MNITDMKIEEVANLINNALQENKGVSVNKICDTLKIKRSTLKSRLTRGGYSFNSDKNKYELIPTKESLNSNVSRTTNNTTYKATDSVLKSNAIEITDKATEHTTKGEKHIREGAINGSLNKATKYTTTKMTDRTTQTTTEKTTKQTIEHITDRKMTIEERITALEIAVEILKGSTRKVTKGITVINTKDTTVKSIRLYTEVKEELDKYIAEHKEIKVIDIISNAIMEYIKRH